MRRPSTVCLVAALVLGASFALAQSPIVTVGGDLAFRETTATYSLMGTTSGTAARPTFRLIGLADLPGTTTAGQLLRSAGTDRTPAYTTATFPATTTANQLLYSSATNTVGGLATAASSVLTTNASSVPAWATTLSLAGPVTSTSGFVVPGTGGGSQTDVSDGETLTLSLVGATTDTSTNVLHAASEIGWIAYRIQTAIAGVYAVGTITMGGVATADEAFVVGAQTFTWKETRAGAGEVTIGATAAAACTNIIAAITADLATVTAAEGDGDTVVVTAAAPGAAGNTIAFSETSTNMAVDQYESTDFLGGTVAGADVSGFTIGDGTNADRFCAAQTTLTAGTPGFCYAHRHPTVASAALSPVQPAAAALRITAAGAVPTAGAIKVVVYQRTWAAPTS